MTERENKTDLGVVKIKDEAIASIANTAALEVKGVAATKPSLAAKFLKPLSKRGVKVDIKENDIKITLYIITEYGVNIPQIANQVQENVKRSIEKMTGISNVEVNVNVQGVSSSPKGM